ncbi:ureidoglycolate lyase [Neobacillus mesonae]|uniref:ureidoglycolate lyase n=1 Tax=Neobacillus mesonae TaxID=1193713 RepID=UPI002E1BEB81|nr:ureidoglycolate lyase [Neobacillus mesonae]MED4203334.1 ureidoglycolate lyase [Neobacillus mesonae]
MDLTKLKVLNKENFSKYGWVLEINEHYQVINDGNSKIWHNLVPPLIFSSCNELNIAMLRTEMSTIRVNKFERHRFTPQLFFPVGENRSLVVVAKGESVNIAPSDVEVFLMDRHQGICFYPLTWHYPLIPIDGPTNYMLLMRQSDVPDVEYSNECGPFTLQL